MKNLPMRYPTTVTLFVVTALVTALQFLVPGLLTALQRSPSIISSNEWWRLFTALFINRGGGAEIALNLTGTFVVSLVAESRLSSLNSLMIYLTGGVVGELAGLAWKPEGAGSSVAFLSLVGALSVYWVFGSAKRAGRIGPCVIFLVAVGLTYFGNIHGPPMIVGACLQALIIWRNAIPRNKEAVGSEAAQ